MNKSRFLAAIALISAASDALAADATRWALCGPAITPPSFSAQANQLTGEQTLINSDKAAINQQGTSVFQGKVELLNKKQALQADYLEFNNSTQDTYVKGDVFFNAGDLSLFSDEGHYNLDQQDGLFENVRFFNEPLHLRGETNQLIRDNSNLMRMDSTSLTTCPTGNDDWLLSGKNVILDKEQGQGTAENVVLRFQHVPIFYTPWMSFPIDDRRKSGFLIPSFGESDRNGTEIIAPYYWNIAPNADFTYTPRILSKQGLLSNGEFRFLHQKGRGKLQVEYLPEDQITGEERYSTSFTHNAQLSRSWSSSVAYNDASDADYFNDFGNDLSIVNITHLERRVDVNFQENNWKLRSRIRNYLTLDDSITASDRPYEQLPQITLNYSKPYSGNLETDFSGEWVYFNRKDSVIGSRLDLTPALQYRLANTGGYVLPRFAYRVTQYDLNDTDPGDPSQPQRALPIGSVDASLFFDKPLSNGGQLSLEPRFYYLYVPFENQADLPDFDTSLSDFSFAQLFSSNRFNGADRQGDANQLTQAITMRWLSPAQRRELFRASLGVISYFDDQQVDLNGAGTNNAAQSSIATELASPITQHLSWRNSSLWDPDREQIERNSTQIQYRLDSQRVFNLGHRFREGDLEQLESSVAWPISRHWKALGQWRYDLESEQDIELLSGLEYESCCWIFRAVGKRFLIDDGNEYNNAIYFQLTLKGLGNFGSNANTLLEDDINGYKSLQ